VPDGDLNERKFSILRDIVYGYDLDIICLTETWLTEAVYSEEIIPTGYSLFRCDRKNRIGGGVLTAVKSNLSSRQIETNFNSLECVLIEITFTPQQTVLPINSYRPPSDRDFIQNFIDMIKVLNLDHYWCTIIVGDFNFPEINWIEGSGFTNSTISDEQKFSDFLMDHFLFQLVSQPTRKTNILDLVITNLPSIVSSVESGPCFVEAGLPSGPLPGYI
jgi:hypothetical protein